MEDNYEESQESNDVEWDKFDDKTSDADLSEAELAAKKSKELASYWVGQITTSTEERRPWLVECREAWREYQNETRKDDPRSYRAIIDWNCANFARYWADTDTIAPTIYSSLPTLKGDKSFNANDDAARAAAIQVENLGAWALKCFGAHQTFQDGSFEYLNSSRLTFRVCWDSEIVKKPVRVPVIQVPSLEGPMIWVTENNEAIPDEAIVVSEGVTNYYEVEGEEETVKAPRVYARVVHFDEILISPGARAPEDVWWIAYRIRCTRKKAVELFGEKLVKKIINSATYLNDKDADESYQLKQSEDLFEYYEVWNKRDKTVACITPAYTEDWLSKPTPDPYGLRGFFPSPPFIYANKRYDNLYPVPDYTQARDSYEQLHILSRRINQVIRTIKAAVIYDGSHPELVAFFTEMTDNTGIACEKYADFVDKGGFDKLVSIPDFSKMAMVLQNLVQSFNAEELKLDRLRGLPEIVRGQANQNLTLGQERMNKAASTARNSTRQRNFESALRDLLEMLVDLALAKDKIPEELLKQITGFDHGDENYQLNWAAGISILKDDEMRRVRLDIETDSTSVIKQEEKRDSALMLIDKAGGYVNNISATIQNIPETAAALISLLNNLVRNMGQGKYVETEVRKSFEQLVAKLSQPPPPPAEPPPDPRLAKIESDERMLQMKLGFEDKFETLNAQLKEMKLQLDARKQTHIENRDISKAQIDDGHLALDAREMQTNEYVATSKLNLEAENQARDNARLEAEVAANIQNPPQHETPKAGVVINVGNNKDPNEVASVVKDPLTGAINLKLPENPI